jgi:hypothetical protein
MKQTRILSIVSGNGHPQQKNYEKRFFFLTINADSINLSPMKLMTKQLTEKLNKAGSDGMVPICKLFTPWGAVTWLITGIEGGILYGFADLGMGCVEWGGIATLGEMEAIRGRFGLKIERDLHWTARADVNYFELETLAAV